MKYVVVEEHKNDTFTKEFETLNEAITYADDDYNRLCDSDKKRITAYYILNSVNPDEDADNHYDGNIVFIYK